MPQSNRMQGLTDEMKERIERILNRIHGTPEPGHPIEEDDFEGGEQAGFIDGGFDDFDEAGFYESEGFLDDAQGHDIDNDPEHVISDSDSDSNGDHEHNSPESDSDPDEHMSYSNFDETESELDWDSEYDEEIPGIHLCYCLDS